MNDYKLLTIFFYCIILNIAWLVIRLVFFFAKYIYEWNIRLYIHTYACEKKSLLFLTLTLSRIAPIRTNTHRSHRSDIIAF